MNRRRGLWLILAGVLLALGAGLMLTGQGDKPPLEAPKVEFPTKMRREEWQRAEQRRTQVLQHPPDAGARQADPRPRDPLLAALPRGSGRSAVVIEANALRHSPVGELLLDCLMRDGGRRMSELRRISGVDPLRDLDRLAITDKGLVLSGNFGNARFKELFQDRVALDYGSGAKVYEAGDVVIPLADGGTVRGRANGVVGTWNDQLIVIGDSPGSVKEVLDQVHGGGSNEPPVIRDGSTYGEMYGVLAVDKFVSMFPPGQEELARRLQEAAETVELHLDARSDMAMVAHIRGKDESKVTDLGRSLGAALSVARLKAQSDGDEELARMLDFAKVLPAGSEFKLELAVPLDALKERLAFCREERKSSQGSER